MRAFRWVAWCMIGGAYMGCAELLGARFDDLEPRPPPDASPEALTEVGEGMMVGDVTRADGSRASGGALTFPRATDATAVRMPRAPGEQQAPQLGGVEDPDVSSDAPKDDPGVDEDLETDGGASALVGPNDAVSLDSAREVRALPVRSDAGVPGAGKDVSPPASPRCAASSPFSRIELVPGIPVNAARIRLSDDELTAHFSWLKESSQWLDLFTSRRAGRASPFSVPEALALLNGSGGETSPSLTPDGATLYFESSRSGFFRIYEAKRSDAGDWAALGIVPNIAVVGFGDGGPYLAPGSGDLYFHSERLGGADLFRAARSQAGFEVPIPLLGVNTQGAESFPLVSADELTLYFLRMAEAPGGQHSEIWRATRRSESEPFGDVQAVAELNTELSELPDWISPDNCRLYFSRMPVTLWLGSVVYVAIREPAPGASAGD